MKTVSVVIATYNGEKYIRKQLDSIIQQTYPIHEIIIQDDCSTDRTLAIVEEYAQRYPNIKLFVNEHNLGFNQNFRNAAMRATGDLVAISDQDDVWFPYKIEKQVEAIGNHDICWSSYTRGTEMKTATILERKCSFERLLFTSLIAGHTMLCQRSFLQDASNWIDSIWYDWGLSLHASLKNGIVKVEAPLNWHRSHEEEAYSKEFNNFKKYNKKVTYQPYIMGYWSYKKLVKNENRKALYNYLYNQTTDIRYNNIHIMCKLLVKSDIISIMRLCRLCQTNRFRIYISSKEPTGIMGWIRGFFFPFFYAYYPQNSLVFKDFSKLH